MQKIAFCLLVSTFLCGCATTSTTKLNIDVPSQVNFIFTDLRDFDTRQSIKASGSQGDVTVMGDDAITPPPAELVRSMLYIEAGHKLAGKSVQLTRFRLEIVNPGGKIDEEQLHNVASSTPGMSPAAVVLAKPFIQLIEDTRSFKQISVNLAVVINNVEVSHILASTYQGRITEDNVNEVLRESLRQLAQKAANM